MAQSLDDSELKMLEVFQCFRRVGQRNLFQVAETLCDGVQQPTGPQPDLVFFTRLEGCGELRTLSVDFFTSAAVEMLARFESRSLRLQYVGDLLPLQSPVFVRVLCAVGRFRTAVSGRIRA